MRPKRDPRSLYVSRYLECRLKNSEAAVGFLLFFFVGGGGVAAYNPN